MKSHIDIYGPDMYACMAVRTLIEEITIDMTGLLPPDLKVVVLPRMGLLESALYLKSLKMRGRYIVMCDSWIKAMLSCNGELKIIAFIDINATVSHIRCALYQILNASRVGDRRQSALTLMEKQVLDCIWREMSVAKIASRLHMSIKMVSTHKRNAMLKFNASSNQELYFHMIMCNR